MADPLSVPARLAGLVGSTVESIDRLRGTINSFESHPERVRSLLGRLDSLIEALNSLRETLEADLGTELSGRLEVPLLRCGQACEGFEQELIHVFSRSNQSRTSFRDWTKLRYMGDDIDDFGNMLEAYASTITIARICATPQKIPLTATDIESYEELSKSAIDTIDARLRSMDERIEALVGRAVETSDAGAVYAAESRHLKDERLSAHEALKTCASIEDLISQSAPQSTTVPNAERAPAIKRLQEEIEADRRLHYVCSKLEKYLEKNANLHSTENINLALATIGQAIFMQNESFAGSSKEIGGYISDDLIRRLIEILTETASQNNKDDGSTSRFFSTPVADGPVSEVESSRKPKDGVRLGDFALKRLPKIFESSSLDIGIPYGEFERHSKELYSPHQPEEAIEPNDRDCEEQKGYLSDSASEPDTIFSESRLICPTESSVSTLDSTALDELVGLLLNHDILHSLYEAAVKKVATEKFQIHLRGFISDYGDRLQQESKTADQMAVSKFVRRSASKVAARISGSMQEHGKFSLDPTLMRYETHNRERLDSYLRELPGNFGPGSRAKSERKTTQLDDSEDEELPNLKGVQSFLTSTRAFENLCQSISDWLKLDVGSSADSVYIESRGPCRPRCDEHNTERNLSKLARFLSSIAIFTLVYWRATMASTAGLRFFLEPRVAAGMERLRWRCSCGKLVYGDFDKTTPEALSKLAKSLKSLGASTEACYAERTFPGTADNPGRITTTLLQQPAPADLATASQNSIARIGGIQLPARTQIIDNASIGDTEDQEQGSARSIQNGTSSPRKVYFEICINSGEHAVTLSEIDVSSVQSDGELFDKIWSTYNGLHRNWLRKLFAKPRGVHFVYFGVRHRHQAGIYKKPMEIPPVTEVNANRYHYHECPLENLPPMPGNVFLHYLSCAHRKTWHCEVPSAHKESYFLQRLPKKVYHSIFDKAMTPGSPSNTECAAFGWGIHIIEGPNHAMLSMALGIGVLVSFVASLIILGIAGTQEQGFGVGQWLLAVVACVLSALYFKLQESFQN